MDKMTIIGMDGKAKYVLTPDNTIVDMRLYQHCACLVSPTHPYKIKGDERICPFCNKPISKLEVDNG